MRRPRDMPRIGSEVRPPWAGGKAAPAGSKQLHLVAVFLILDALGAATSILNMTSAFVYVLIATGAALIVWKLAHVPPSD